MRKVYTGYCGTSEIEHGLCACTVDNPLATARGLSLRTDAQAMLYLSHKFISFAVLLFRFFGLILFNDFFLHCTPTKVTQIPCKSSAVSHL